MRCNSTCATVALALSLFSIPASAAVKGDVFQSKGGETPFFIWDATPAVVDIVDAKEPRDVALHGLEASAVDVLAEREPGLRGAKRLTLRMIYQKTGAVNPQYGTATLTGIERVFELTADASAIHSNHKALSTALAGGKVPPGVRVVVSGQLPPL